MESSPKQLCIAGLVLLLAVTASFEANAAGECPRSTPDNEAMKLIPCASAANDPDVVVSKNCCTQVQNLGQNPKCLCAVLLSNMAKAAGVKPEIAITIPKRCNLVNRPIGYKCGGIHFHVVNKFHRRVCHAYTMP